MGIYDRDYYRGAKTSFLGSLSDRNLVCTCEPLESYAEG